MIFFDDMTENIYDVSKLNVLSILTPSGFEKQHFDEGMRLFN